MNRHIPALWILLAAIPGTALGANAKQAECTAYADTADKTIRDAVAEKCPFAFNQDPLWTFARKSQNSAGCMALPRHAQQSAAKPRARDVARGEGRHPHLRAKAHQAPPL